LRGNCNRIAHMRHVVEAAQPQGIVSEHMIEVLRKRKVGPVIGDADQLNAVSLIGIVVMIGMADNEAVVKLDAIHRFRDLGYPIDEAIFRGGHKRLRAITMTTFTAIAGVIPLVLNLGSGGALYQPLAAAVIGGSITQLAVTFFLMPALYAAIERRKERLALRRAAAQEVVIA